MRPSRHSYDVVAIAIALSVAPCVSAQSAETLNAPPVVLQESAATPINVPVFSSFDAAQCDEDGSIYSLVKPQGMAHEVVISIPKDGQSKNVYTVDQLLDHEPGTVAFGVAPNGAISLLDQLPDKGTYLQRYDEHGRPTAPIRIALPSSRLNVSQIAVSSAGKFLLSGMYGDEEPSPRKGAPFLPVFDADGQHFREVTGIEHSELVTHIENTHIEQALTIGDDGSFYLQVRGNIFVINEAAQVLRTLKLSDWSADSFADFIKVSGNRILIGSLTLDAVQARKANLHLKMYDLTTGALIATYDPSAVSSTVACFDYRKGLTFLKVQQGRLFFVSTALP